MINNQLKEYCYSCNHGSVDVESETMINCTGDKKCSTTIFCRHACVCEMYRKESTRRGD